MADPTLQDLRLNIERITENQTTLKLEQDKDSLVLYGNKDIRLPGLLERTEKMEDAIKNINGMPQEVKELREQVEELKVCVNTLIETDKKRVWTIRGMAWGLGLNVAGIGTMLVKVFS